MTKFGLDLQDFRLRPWFMVTQPGSRVGLVPWRSLLGSDFMGGGQNPDSLPQESALGEEQALLAAFSE